MQRIILLCVLLLSIFSAHAAITYTGAQLAIPYQSWQKLDAPQAVMLGYNHAANDKYQWIPLNGNPHHDAGAISWVRSTLQIEHQPSQKILLIMPYAFSDRSVVRLFYKGELQQEYTFDTPPVTTAERMRWAFGVIPLAITEPGNYELVVKAHTSSLPIVFANTQLIGEDDYLLFEHPKTISVGSGFLGAIATYFLCCLALLLFRVKSVSAYALLFLGSSFVALSLGTGNLFYQFAIDSVWWMKRIYPMTMTLTYAGALLYIYHNLTDSNFPRLRRALASVSWCSVIGGFLFIWLQSAERSILVLAVATLNLTGFTLALVLITTRAFNRNLRHIIFACCCAPFLIVSAIRTLTPLTNIAIPIIYWYYSLSFLAAYIQVNVILGIAREHIRTETRKTVESTRFDLIGRFSHELRTPLNAVIGLADLLKHSKDAQQTKHYASMIHSAGFSLLALVNDILDFSRLGQTQTSIAATPFRLDKVISAIFSVFIHRAVETQVNLRVFMAPQLPFFLVGDELRFTQILNNLFSNAIKFSPSGSTVALNIELGRMEIDRIELLFTLTDQGRGIPAEKLATIFEPFAQVKVEDGTTLGGSGLGLAICKMLIEQMSGEINVTSVEDKGTTFTFNLWFKPDLTAPDVTQLLAPLRDRHILLLMDKTIADQFQPTLEFFGAHVIQSESPINTQTHTDKHNWDIVLSTGRYCHNADIAQWLNQLPATTTIEILEINPLPAHIKLNHPNLHLLTIPQPRLSILLTLIEHLTGKGSNITENTDTSDALINYPHRVLLVDDNNVNLMVAGKLLSSLGVDNVTAAGGKAALDQLHSATDYSLVLLDCEMPDIDGFEVCRRWRAHEIEQGLSRLPIVALTAHALHEITNECLAAGMDAVIYKPVGRKKLIQTLNQFALHPQPASNKTETIN